MTGARVLVRALEDLGVEHVFTVPGTQNVDLLDALRASRVATVVATNELAAGFMANGYARGSGRVGVLATIPGPGFAFTLPAIAEAFLDSAPLLHVCVQPAEGYGAFRLQAIGQAEMATPVVKRVVTVDCCTELRAAVEAGYALAASGEPGPVLLHVGQRLLGERCAEGRTKRPENPTVAPAVVADVARALSDARRVVLLVGQGAAGAADQIRTLAELLHAPVVPTTSGRGVLEEDHPLAFVFDSPTAGARPLNELLAACDLVVALGCKLSHNATFGYQLRLDSGRLVHVDASPSVLGASYPAAVTGVGDVAALVDALLSRLGGAGRGWGLDELDTWRRRADAHRQQTSDADPRIRGVEPATPGAFFAALRRALPREGCVVTDSGLHQFLVRRYFPVLAPRGLVVPSDFQSMGFGIPAAIGAGMATPERPVVAVVGDGGLAASGLEVLTAVRERPPLTVVVFTDGYYGLIRVQQLARFGRAHGVDVPRLDIAALAASVGAEYVRLEDHAYETLHAAITSPDVTLVEVVLEDAAGLQRLRRRGVARRALGPALVKTLRRFRR